MTRLLSLALALALLGGCKDGGDSGTTYDTSGAPVLDSATSSYCAETYQVTWENWGDGFFATYCRACHSETTPDRLGAPEGLDFDSISQVRNYEALVRQVVLEEETMPVGGGVYEEDLILLEILLDCAI